MRYRKARRPTKAELRALGATPGLVVSRYAPGGERATVEELTAESGERSPFFRHRLTSTDEDTQPSEGGQ